MQCAALDKGIRMIECDPHAASIATTTKTTCDQTDTGDSEASVGSPQECQKKHTAVQEQLKQQVYDREQKTQTKLLQVHRISAHVRWQAEARSTEHSTFVINMCV